MRIIRKIVGWIYLEWARWQLIQSKRYLDGMTDLFLETPPNTVLWRFRGNKSGEYERWHADAKLHVARAERMLTNTKPVNMKMVSVGSGLISVVCLGIVMFEIQWERPITPWLFWCGMISMMVFMVAFQLWIVKKYPHLTRKRKEESRT